MGVAARTVTAPDGREWQVRVYRFRGPEWRRFRPVFHEEDDFSFFILVDLILGLISAFLAILVLPLLAILIETPARALQALVTDERWVEAAAPGPPASRLVWRTDSRHAEPVAVQVARQLELGYNRVEPHNAVFEGFAG